MTPDQKKQIAHACKSITDDRAISDYLNVPIAMVREVRREMMA